MLYDIWHAEIVVVEHFGKGQWAPFRISWRHFCVAVQRAHRRPCVRLYEFIQIHTADARCLVEPPWELSGLWRSCGDNQSINDWRRQDLWCFHGGHFHCGPMCCLRCDTSDGHHWQCCPAWWHQRDECRRLHCPALDSRRPPIAGKVALPCSVVNVHAYRWWCCLTTSHDKVRWLCHTGAIP